MAEPAPTIEREKIRHRRPNDLLFDGPEPPPVPRAPAMDDVDDRRHAGEVHTEDDGYYVDEPTDWMEEDDDAPASAWDDESEDDWVLHGEDDAPSRSDLFDEDLGQEDDYVEIYDKEEKSGVVWEDDTVSGHRSFEQPDEIAFDQQPETFGFAPEVELAGRRDVRPKPPRPAPPPRAAAARRPPVRQQRMAAEPRGPRQDEARLPQDRSGETELQGRRNTLELSQRSGEAAARPSPPPADPDRFSRTRATLGMASGGMAADAARIDDQVLQQPRRAPGGRRRQTQKAPPPANMPKRDRYGAISSRRGRAKWVIVALLLALLAGGGWYGYRTIGLEGVQPMIDRLATLIPPLPGMSRTAADTSFGGGEPAGSPSAEQAPSDLEQRIGQAGDGGQSGDGDVSEDAIDPATVDAVGPPIPAFKPSPLGATRSLAADAPATSGDQAQLAANGDNEGGEPSFLEQLWQFLRPG